MDDKKKKKADIINLFKKGSEPETINRIKIKGNNNIAVGGDFKGDINVNPKITKKNLICPTEKHISDKTAAHIQRLIKTIASKEEVAGMELGKANAKWHTVLKNRFKVTSYKLIPIDLGDQAIAWLSQQTAIKNVYIKNIKRSPLKEELCDEIWIKAEKLNLSKAHVYNIAYKIYNKKVSSLKQLTKDNLMKIYIHLNSI